MDEGQQGAHKVESVHEHLLIYVGLLLSEQNVQDDYYSGELGKDGEFEGLGTSGTDV